ncbi:hypothetical protein OOK31_25590 [Streptomyces sp. NBC_00249]|uniref:hypothetical protein n=1 Tax=Streptomyces sp. NBC_00249 TaxID=2975690 RepID=UPI00225323EC|nr:hypothetical protein [Streptomyces sp. NBC_00249]MCX5197231.1 hypothetical protein [Streptomyces sp. NBC_00249]
MVVVPDARVELKAGGTWVDATDDMVEADGIRYSWGRRAEGSRTDPSAASLTLRNPDGKYSSRNPLSPYYGQLGRNTPIRLTHDGADVALYLPTGTAGRAATPDHASLDVTGDLDLRVEVTPSAWGGVTTSGAWELAGKYGLAGQRSWLWDFTDLGKVQFFWSVDGTALVNDITPSISLPVGSRAALRVTLDVNNGAGGYTVTHYTAASIAGPWTQFSQTVTTSGTTSIFNSTASVEVGDVAWVGFADRSRRFHAFEMRNGIGGSVVANPVFTAQASGTTSFTDAAGRTWTTADGGEITSRRIRAVLEASSWTPEWGASGHDVTTPVEAAGVLRRLGQGDKPLASTLRRRIPAYSPVAYWPMEEGRDATQAASPIPGVLPLTVSGFEFAADDTCPGSVALPKINAAASAMAPVPAYTATGQYLVSYVYLQPTLPSGDNVILDMTTTGSSARITISVGPGLIKLRGYSSAGTLVLSHDGSSTGWDGPVWHRFDFSATDVGGGNVEYHMAWIIAGSGGFQSNTTVAATVGTVTGISTAFGAELADMRIGHLVVFPTSTTTVFSSADGGYAGERAAARVVRLAGEEGVRVSALTAGADTTLMGPQRPDTLLDLLDECEAADGGILYEDREVAGIAFRGRTSLYNQTPKLTIPYGQLAPPLAPTDDDRHIRNDRTITRAGGSSARAVLTSGTLSTAAPPNGVGVYDDSQTLNLNTDDQCADIAGWLLHRGTWDEARYPQVTIYLHKYPALIPAVSALQPGDVVRITGLPVWLPPGPLDLMVEGATEVFKPFEWVITLACSPAGLWTVAVADSATLGRADTTGSQLASGVTSTATSLSVATASGPLWSTTSPPYDVQVGGEVMTVTAVSGASSPQTFTVVRSVNGIVKAQSSGAAVGLVQPARAAL